MSICTQIIFFLNLKHLIFNLLYDQIETKNIFTLIQLKRFRIDQCFYNAHTGSLNIKKFLIQLIKFHFCLRNNKFIVEERCDLNQHIILLN